MSDRSGSYEVEQAERAARNARGQLRDYINQTDFLSGRALNENGAQGVVDVGLNWPLTLQFVSLNVVTVAGTNQFTIFRPQPNFHAVVLSSQISFFTPPGPVDQSPLSLQLNNVNTPVAFDSSTMIRVLMSDTIAVYPLVGGRSAQIDAAAGFAFELTGLNPVYLNDSTELVLFLGSQAAGTGAFLRTVVVRAPKTQPLGALLAPIY